MAGPIVAEDIYRFRWINHVRLSRDGERVAYQVGWADSEARQNRSRVVVRRLLDAEPVEPTGGVRRDHSPEWSPDGTRLAFVSRVGPADQLFVTEVSSGGLTRQLTTGAEGVSSPVWSPDGRWIAFTALVLSDPDAVVDDPRPAEGREQARRAPVARIARRLDYKHDGQGYTDGRHHHLFVVPAAGGDAKQLTRGGWDIIGFDWSPDGTKLVAAGNAEADSDLKRELNLYVVDLDAKLKRLGGGFYLSSPAWSPRGDLIAFIAPSGPEAGLMERLWVVPLNGDRPRCLTAGFDQAVDDSIVTDMRAGHGARIQWSSDGDRLYFLSSGSGVTCIYSADLAGNVRQEAGGARRIYDFDVASGVIAFCASDPSTPGELHMLTQGAEAKLTNLNPWLKERTIVQPEHHHFTAPDGWRLEGWVLKPIGFDANRLHPLVMEIHGGPHGQYGWAFFHEFQVLAGMGYVVFYLNPRGSDGYGERFRREVVQDWGGKDYADLMTSLDQIIERTNYVDTHRLGVGGGSYGGYMTNWILGQTDRFAAAVAMRSICNLVSEYPQHDIVPWGVLELGAPPWPNQDELWRRSPIRYVQNFETPLLLTCGEMDLRCAISQSEELFGAMRLLGKTVEMVRFPEESHDMSRNGRPDRRIERLRRIAGWFERFLGTASSERPTEPATQVLAVPAEAPQEWAKRIAALAAMIEAPEGPAAATQAPPAVFEERVEQTSENGVPPTLVIQGRIAEPEPAPAAMTQPEPPPAGYVETPTPPVPQEAQPQPSAFLAPTVPPVIHEATPVPPLMAEPEPAPAELIAAPAAEPEPAPDLAPTVPPYFVHHAPAAAYENAVAPTVTPPFSQPVAEPVLEPAGVEAPPEAAPSSPIEVLESAELAEAVVLQPELPEPHEMQVEVMQAPAMPPVVESEPEPVAAVAEHEALPQPVESFRAGEPAADEPAPPFEPTPALAAEPAPALAAEPAPALAAEPAPALAAEPAPAPAAEPLRPEFHPARTPDREPAAASSAFSTQPGAAGAYADVESTIVAWPTGPGAVRSTRPQIATESVDEATSIIPVWRHQNSEAESTKTVSLQAVPPEEIAAGKGFAARLTFETGPFAGRIVAVPLEMVTIGRALDNDIVVGDPATSAHHGRIEVRGGTFWISDLGSTNGTLVNGEPIIDKQLANKDLVAIGQNTMRFTLEA